MNERRTYAVLRTGRAQRIAVTSQNFRTITGHAGKCRRFLLFECDGQGPPIEIERLDLPVEMSLHSYHGEEHPLFGLALNALITQGAGQGFVQRMARHGIQVYMTSATDPLLAVTAVAQGEPLPPAPAHEHLKDALHTKD